MEVDQILQELDSEIARLTEVRHLLAGHASPRKPGRPAGRPAKKKRVLSAEARERISAAQRKRWAAQKKAAK